MAEVIRLVALVASPLFTGSLLKLVLSFSASHVSHHWAVTTPSWDLRRPFSKDGPLHFTAFGLTTLVVRRFCCLLVAGGLEGVALDDKDKSGMVWALLHPASPAPVVRRRHELSLL